MARLGIRSVQDLLFHLPIRYEDRTRIVSVDRLRPGLAAGVVGVIQSARVTFGRRRSLLVTLADDTGHLVLRFFHFSGAQKNGLSPGVRLQCYGEVRPGPQGLEIVHPEYQRLEADQPVAVDDHLTPVYPATEGLNQGTLRRLTALALTRIRDPGALDDYLPPGTADALGFPALPDAILALHRPAAETTGETGSDVRDLPRRRLAFEELLAHGLGLRRWRRALDAERAPVLDCARDRRDDFLGRLTFALTEAQIQVLAEIGDDLARTCPMNRLLQGDVGSGKTVVAALAALRAVDAGYQVAIMAPTELLAEQHLESFEGWFAPLGVTVRWLSGKMAKDQRDATLGAVAGDGAADIVVGTHALLQESVRFARLGLVIIDEQHRFGVDQRLLLYRKGQTGIGEPHRLVMTATPIPRTLALTAYADLDVSVIDALPGGREPVDTAALPQARRQHVVERVAHACASGHQAYWVCTIIEESEVLTCEAASDAARSLAECLPQLRVGLVHGRMKRADRERTMAEFKSGRIHLLVATTVVEVSTLR